MFVSFVLIFLCIYLVRRAIFRTRARSFCWANISLRLIILKSIDSRRTIRPEPPRPGRTPPRLLDPRKRETKPLRIGGLFDGGPIGDRCLGFELPRSPCLDVRLRELEETVGGGGGGGVRLPLPVDDVRL